jgi:hypothetical protein
VKNSRNRKVLALQKSSYKKKIKFLDGVLPTFLDTRMGIKYINIREMWIKMKRNLDFICF